MPKKRIQDPQPIFVMMERHEVKRLHFIAADLECSVAEVVRRTIRDKFFPPPQPTDHQDPKPEK